MYEAFTAVIVSVHLATFVDWYVVDFMLGTVYYLV